MFLNSKGSVFKCLLLALQKHLQFVNTPDNCFNFLGKLIKYFKQTNVKTYMCRMIYTLTLSTLLMCTSIHTHTHIHTTQPCCISVVPFSILAGQLDLLKSYFPQDWQILHWKV